MKVEVGIEPEGDIARVRAVREAIGPRRPPRRGRQRRLPGPPATPSAPSAAWKSSTSSSPSNPSPRSTSPWLADVRANVRVPVMADEHLHPARRDGRRPRRCRRHLRLHRQRRRHRPRAQSRVAEAAGLTCTIGIASNSASPAPR
ncbi:MAG: hypothetical protein U0232_24150 [Thermomicrobiales bacterium]